MTKAGNFNYVAGCMDKFEKTFANLAPPGGALTNHKPKLSHTIPALSWHAKPEAAYRRLAFGRHTQIMETMIILLKTSTPKRAKAPKRKRLEKIMAAAWFSGHVCRRHVAI